MVALSQPEFNYSKSLPSKVPHITFAFWIIKILATTLGETGSEAVTMTLQPGDAIASLIGFSFFGIIIAAQMSAKRYHSWLYWAAVVATTTVGTAMSDYFGRTLGLGYVKASVILFSTVLVVLLLWHWVGGRIECENITTRNNERSYWVTVLVSNTFGTALGDFIAIKAGLGFEGGALMFSGLIGLVAGAHCFTKISPSVLFWSAYVLTRPLGATLGDTLTKPFEDGGFALNHILASFVIAALMIMAMILTSKRVKWVF